MTTIAERDETSKARLAEIRQAEADLKTKAKDTDTELRTDSARNSVPGKPASRPRGRPTEPASERQVAKATGIPPTTQREIAKHVEFAEAFPFMQRSGWLQHSVLEAGIAE